MSPNTLRVSHKYGVYIELNQRGGSGLGLTQNSWFNSCHGLFFPLTLIINANTLSLKHLMNILPVFNLKIEFYMP